MRRRKTKLPNEPGSHTADQDVPNPIEETSLLTPQHWTKEMLFPTYPWNFENEEHPRSSFFFGEIPDNWRRYSKSSEWTWDLDLFPSLVWYFRQLKWLDEPQDCCISWLELCLDFQCSTHQWIKPSNEALGVAWPWGQISLPETL